MYLAYVPKMVSWGFEGENMKILCTTMHEYASVGVLRVQWPEL